MEFKIDKDKFDAMISAVGEELEQMLSKSAVDDDPGEDSAGDGAPVDPDGQGDVPPPSDDEGSAAPEASPEVSPEQEAAAAAPDGSPEHEQGEIEPAPTVEALQGEYAKLDPEALKMHYLAAKAALVQSMGDQSAPPPVAPEASAPPAPAPDAFGKSEAWKNQQNEVKALKKALADQEAKFEKMLSTAHEESNKAVEKLAEVLLMPVRKSVKGISDVKFIGKTGDEAGEKVSLTKAQVKEKLSTLIRSGSLSKSDKDKIAQYDVTHDISKIEHLLVEAAK